MGAFRLKGFASTVTGSYEPENLGPNAVRGRAKDSIRTVVITAG